MATDKETVFHGYLQLSDSDKIALNKSIEDYAKADALTKSIISVTATITVVGLQLETKSNGPMASQSATICPCCKK